MDARCKDCCKYELKSIKDDVAFDTEYRQFFPVQIDYCDSLHAECDPDICEYREIKVKAYDLEAIKSLLIKTLPDIGDTEKINIQTALKQINEFLQI